MAMTFLQLVNRVRQNAGITTSDLTTLDGVTGEDLLIKNWVIDANRDVSTKCDSWLWLKSSFSFVTVTSQGSYTATQAGATNFKRWAPDTFRSYITASGYSTEQRLNSWDWEEFKDHYLFGSQRTVAGRPSDFSVAPDKSLYFAPIPESTLFTIIGDYWKSPTLLSANADVQAFPESFDMITVWRAMWYYGMYESASETVAVAQSEYTRMMRELRRDQLPKTEMAGPLA